MLGIIQRLGHARLFLLAAILWLGIPSAFALRAPSTPAASSSENRVGGSEQFASGRFWGEDSESLGIAAGCGTCGYESASDRPQWLNPDPIGENGGLNLYGSVGNNLLRWVDPYGLYYGDWWDPRTWFNSGFTDSWYDSANSIGEGLGNALAGNWEGVGDAYDSGVLGQTKDAGPITKYGTRAALGCGVNP